MRGSSTINKIDRRLEALMININKKQENSKEKMSSTPLDGVAIMAKLESMEEKFRELGKKATGQHVLAAKKFMQNQVDEQREKKAYFHWGEAFQGIKLGAVSQPTNTEARIPHSWDNIEAGFQFLEVVADTGYSIDIRELHDFSIAPYVFHPQEDWVMTQNSGWIWMRGPLGHSELSEVSTAAYYMAMGSE
jgi:hypothetical protein